MKAGKENEAPQESAKTETETEKESENEKQSYGWIFAIVLAAIIVVGLAYGYTAVTGKNRLTKMCNEIASSPDLKYPTTCVPLTTDSSGGDYIDTRSNPMCRCKVDMGNGTTTVIDVRVDNAK